MLDGIRMSSYRQFLVETTLEVHKLEKWAGSLAEEQFWGMLRMPQILYAAAVNGSVHRSRYRAV